MTEVNTLKKEKNTEVITEDILREAADRIQNNGRKKAPEPPEGGISQSEAARKYKLPQRTISRWVERGYIPVLLRTGKEVYISESVLKKVVEQYKKNPGQGKKTIKNSIKI